MLHIRKLISQFLFRRIKRIGRPGRVIEYVREAIRIKQQNDSDVVALIRVIHNLEPNTPLYNLDQLELYYGQGTIASKLWASGLRPEDIRFIRVNGLQAFLEQLSKQQSVA